MCQLHSGAEDTEIRFQGFFSKTLCMLPSALLGSSIQLVSDQIITAQILNFNQKINIHFFVDSQSYCCFVVLIVKYISPLQHLSKCVEIQLKY